jgi:hypothetical protein
MHRYGIIYRSINMRILMAIYWHVLGADLCVYGRIQGLVIKPFDVFMLYYFEVTTKMLLLEDSKVNAP